MKNIFLLLLLFPTLGLAKSRPDTLWTRLVDHTTIARAVQAWDGIPLLEQSSLGVIDTLSCLTPEALCASPDGGVVMAATFTRNRDTTKTIVVYKTDEAGTMQWTKFYRRGRSSWAADLQLARDGGYLLVGTMESLTPGLTQVWILRLTADGDTLWTRMYRAHHYNYACKIRELPNGGFVVGLTTYSDLITQPGTMNIITYDSAGTPQWGKTYRDSIDIALNDLIVTEDGHFFVIGKTIGGDCANAVYADGQTGEIVWQKHFPGWWNIIKAHENDAHEILWLGQVQPSDGTPVSAMMRINKAGDSLRFYTFPDLRLLDLSPLNNQQFVAIGQDNSASGINLFSIDGTGKANALNALLYGHQSLSHHKIVAADNGIIAISATDQAATATERCLCASDLLLVKYSLKSIH